MRAATDDPVREGQLLGWGVAATGVLVETLLDRGAESDVTEAEAAIERLAAAPADEGLVRREAGAKAIIDRPRTVQPWWVWPIEISSALLPGPLGVGMGLMYRFSTDSASARGIQR